jgi:UDP-N-acetylglucosamine--N-acetylmuramyl-(pentapeptide) pyrophosphoryl-undecaprenol N-acetylglucosamine transferase
MVDALASRAQAWQVLHITGAGKAESVERAYRDCGLTAVVMEFCECMGLIYAAADLVIGRAGANTIAELTATGTAAVLVPYPFHRDRHQHHNAAPMVAAGAAVLVEDAMDLAENARRLQGALVGLLDDPSRLTGMARSARSLARPAAAAEVARWLIGEG